MNDYNYNYNYNYKYKPRKGREGKGREGKGREGEGEGKVNKCKNVALGGLPVFVLLCLLGAPGHGGLANGPRMEKEKILSSITCAVWVSFPPCYSGIKVDCPHKSHFPAPEIASNPQVTHQVTHHCPGTKHVTHKQPNINPPLHCQPP